MHSFKAPTKPLLPAQHKQLIERVRRKAAQDMLFGHHTYKL
jgi:hypothetical protein